MLHFLSTKVCWSVGKRTPEIVAMRGQQRRPPLLERDTRRQSCRGCRHAGAPVCGERGEGGERFGRIYRGDVRSREIEAQRWCTSKPMPGRRLMASNVASVSQCLATGAMRFKLGVRQKAVS